MRVAGTTISQSWAPWCPRVSSHLLSLRCSNVLEPDHPRGPQKATLPTGLQFTPLGRSRDFSVLSRNTLKHPVSWSFAKSHRSVSVHRPFALAPEVPTVPFASRRCTPWKRRSASDRARGSLDRFGPSQPGRSGSPRTEIAAIFCGEISSYGEDHGRVLTHQTCKLRVKGPWP